MDFDFNKYQSKITDEILEKYPQEIQEQFLQIINGIPFVKSLIAKDRPRACELQTDDKGRIIVDVTKPHILENMDYFRPAALHYKKYGCYTNLAPNSNPNSEYGKWIREEIRRCYEGYMRKSDGEWITGDYYFFLNYCPIQVSRKEKGKKSKSSQRLIDFPNVWDGHYYLFHYLEQARENGHHACMLAARGKGKAHPYSQNVLTLDGWKKWGDLHIGDYLYGDDGKLTKIIDIPFDDECDIYNVTLRDGRVIQCSDGHLFKVKDHSRGKICIKSLKEIMLDYKRKRIITEKCTKGIEYNYRIPKISNYVVFASKQVSIDPYTLGLMIGDGCFRVDGAKNYIIFTCDKNDIVTYKNNIPYKIDKITNDSYTYCVRCSNEYLRNINLWGLKSEDKFIPSDYLYNDYNVRLNLLKGLMDSDGTVDKVSGIPIFCTTSERLKNDFEFLCRSLGFNISTSAKIPKCNNKEYLKCYNIRVVTNVEIFNLERKQKLVSKFSTGYSKSTKDYTAIVDIKYSHKEKAKCVTVDNESHCYIVGDFVVTHNSYTSAARIAKRFILGESKEVCKKVQCVVTASERKYIQGANQVLDMFVYYIDFIANNTQFPAKRLVNSLHDMQWTMGYIDAENNTKKGTLNSVTGITSKDDESKLRGSRGQLYVIEEAGSFPRLLQLYAVLRPSVEDGSNVFGQVYMYGCVCAGTKVWTNDGRYINIEKLKKEDGIIGYENDLPVKNSIGTLLEPKEKPCIRITYNTDKVLECSIDHPILKQIVHTPRIKGTLHSRNRTHEEVWVRADELKVGDKIIEGRYIGAFGNDVLGDARLIGMLIGDGSYGFDNTPKFSNEDEELLNYIKSKYQWSLDKEHITKQGKLYQEIRVKNICQLLRKIGIYGQTKTAKRLPTNYQILTEQDTKDLLAGLFDTDGCVYLNKENTTVSLVQSNKEILKQVQLLLRKFGIISCIVENKPNIRYDRKDRNPWYILSISGRINIRLFKKYIPIIQNRKVNKLNEICAYFDANPIAKKRCWDDEKIIIRTISKIENIGIQTIYNLSAEQSHTYLANNIITHNTAGDNESDFSSMQEIMYNPKGYNMQELPNVYDLEGQGRKDFTYFFPSYLNMAECYDENGNSDVIKALLEILRDRYIVKYNSTDIRMITKRMAELPITPKEAVLQTANNLFPITELQERLLEIDNNPSFYNDTYVGELVVKPNGEVEFKPTTDTPIREFKINDNNIVEGALEIFEMPATGVNGKIPPDRYIIGHDPVDNDEDKQGSLSSTFVLDLWTDRIVAEYTGRKRMADDNFEILRRLCLFYNAKCLYEQNIKGCFAYFSQKNCLHLLADTPEYLVDKQLIKSVGYGNTSKGVRATLPINNYANKLIQQWMLKPIVKLSRDSNGQEIEVQVPNLFNIKNRALLRECIQYTPLQGNYDRIRALGLVMLYREEKVVLYQGQLDMGRNYIPDDYIGNDPFFNENYNNPYDNEVESY